MNSRERVLDLFEGKNVDHLCLMPITMQLAADMIDKKYREYITDHRVLVEGQLRVVDEFDFDHVSCISDPGREAGDCGAKIIMEENSPAAIDNNNALLSDKKALASLEIPDIYGGGRMHDRIKACELFKEKVGDDKIIEGWVEGPCAEGSDLRGISVLMMDFFEDPDFVKDLFEFCVEMGIQFAKAQIEAGCDVIGVGDAAASLVGPKIYNDQVWKYEKRLIDEIHKMGGAVRLHICGNTTDILESMCKLGCEYIDIDYPVDIVRARNDMPGQIIAGNINPVSVLRDMAPDDIYKEIEKCHKAVGEKFIVAAGCEVPRDTSFENIRAMTDYAKNN